jgi:hypothetical protein
MINRTAARRLTLAAALAVALPGTLPAQFTLSPTIGLYVPTTDLVAAANGQSFRQQIGLALGARAGIQLGSRISLEATGSYVPSNLKATLSGTGTTTDKANLWFGSGRATVMLLPATSALFASLGGGVSLVGRGGKAYQGADAGTDVGGVAGGVVGFRLSPGFGVYLAADDYIYRPKSYASSLSATVRTQHDLHLSLGFGLPPRH